MTICSVSVRVYDLKRAWCRGVWTADFSDRYIIMLSLLLKSSSYVPMYFEVSRLELCAIVDDIAGANVC